MPDALAQALAADQARLGPQMSVPQAEDPRRGPENKSVDDEDKAQFLEVRKLRTQYLDYLSSKVDEIEEQKDSRHMYHGAQWTPEQIRILRRRHQPVMTWNRINRKLNGIVGLVERMRSDPKAMPRNVRSESGAGLATQVIREVLDVNDWKGIEPWCALQACIDGVAGVQMVLTKGDQQDPDIALPWVIGDEFFYDPKSYRLDFADARYLGLSKWLDIGEAIELFSDKEDLLRGLIEGDADLTTNADREYKWIITSTQRIRLIEHWYKHRGNWCWAFYVSSVLLDQGLSPFFDENGKRVSSFKMFSVAVDHDGDRYGFVRNLKGPQDSLNQSKSKSLHLANSRRLIGEKGAVDDVEKARTEWARPDGYVEINPGKSLKPDDKAQDLTAFTAFAEDAKNEIDQFANINMAILSGAGISNISGRAIELLRQPGMAELGPFILAIRQWKLQLYRLIWLTAQRYWKTERWLRMVDNDQQKPVFIQLNGISLDKFGRPALVNALGAVDVDIILEEGPDVASVMQETFDLLRGYPPGTFPPQMIIEMSTLPRAEKNRILAMMAPKPPPPAAQIAAKLKLEGEAAKNAKSAADARRSDALATKAQAEAGQTAAETQQGAVAFETQLWKEALGLMQPPQPPQQPGMAQSASQQTQEAAPPSLAISIPPGFSAPRMAKDGKMYVRHLVSGRYHRVDHAA